MFPPPELLLEPLRSIPIDLYMTAIEEVTEVLVVFTLRPLRSAGQRVVGKIKHLLIQRVVQQQVKDDPESANCHYETPRSIRLLQIHRCRE